MPNYKSGGSFISRILGQTPARFLVPALGVRGTAWDRLSTLVSRVPRYGGLHHVRLCYIAPWGKVDDTWVIPSDNVCYGTIVVGRD